MGTYGTYTALHSSLWDWEPFTELDCQTRILWLALYTSAESKRIVPGLWHGGIAMMCEAARMPADHVLESLDKLIERNMVEWDPKTRVLRMCSLPDCSEEPTSWQALKGFWNRFQSVPACPIRDAHVATIWWTIEEGSRRRGKRYVDEARMKMWRETFGTIAIPAPRKRGVRHLLDNDTSNSVQGSLFAPKALPSASAGPDLFDALPGTSYPLEGSSYPQEGEGSALRSETERFQDQGGGIDTPGKRKRDPDLLLSSVPDSEICSSAPPERSRDVVESEDRARHAPEAAPTLRVVLTARKVAEVIAASSDEVFALPLSERRLRALERAVPDLVRGRIAETDLNALGAFLARNRQAAPGWLSWIDRGGLLDAVTEARAWWGRQSDTSAHVSAETG